ncbi:MAG: hypothetical protein OWS74_01950, partial [Firmicutes bacterium]|nr:hypothetical protein [Bacillota bacterium]
MKNENPWAVSISGNVSFLKITKEVIAAIPVAFGSKFVGFCSCCILKIEVYRANLYGVMNFCRDYS